MATPTKTMIHTVGSGTGTWDVYRVKTGWSVYLVGLHHHNGRRSVVMRGEPGSAKQDLIVRDADPRIGDRSVWDVPIHEWPGHALDVATVITSPVESVARVEELRTIAAVTNVGVKSQRTAVAVVTGQTSSPKPGELRQRAYPESYVEHAEDAASLLRAIARKPQVFDDVGDDPLLRDRLRLALADCALVLETINCR